jgi:hypothetical protein
MRAPVLYRDRSQEVPVAKSRVGCVSLTITYITTNYV